VQSIASNQSSLRCPLNEVFGSRGQIRLLRVLTAEPEIPLHPSDAASQAGMTESGARKALRRLTRTGLVAKVETDHRDHYVFRPYGALGKEIARLFQVEREWSEALAHAIRRAIRKLPAPPALVWVQDFLTGWTDCLEVAVHCGRISSVICLEALREQLGPVEEEFEVLLNLHHYDAEEMKAVDWSGAVVLLRGQEPVESTVPGVDRQSSSISPFPETGRLNPKSAAFSGALVALLEENLSVLRRARENLRGQLDQPQNGNGHDLWEWKKILDTFSLPRLLNFLESDSPRAIRLRATSPFPAILSEEEMGRLAELATHPD